MALSPEQIDRLYEFTRQHYVVYYDLQTELVDHLAHAIESELEIHPQLSFEEILSAEFKKFGIFGFTEIVEKRQLALTKKYHKIVGRAFLNFFKSVKAIYALAVFAIATCIFSYSSCSDLLFSTSVAVVTLFLIINILIGISKRPKPGQKRWLFEEIIRSYGSAGVFIIVPIQLSLNLFRHDFLINSGIGTVMIFSAALVLYAIFCYIIFRQIPAKARQILRENYPEYNVAST